MLKLSYKNFFHTLGSTTRLEIIHALRKGSLNVTDIIKATSFKQSTVSHNLKQLACCRFVHVEQKGLHRYYSLNKETILPILKIIEKHVKNYCPNKNCN